MTAILNIDIADEISRSARLQLSAIFILLSLLLIPLQGAFAQNAAGQTAADAVTAALSEKISLTEEQEGRLAAVAEEHYAAEGGALWYVAAELHQILSAGQLQALRHEMRGERSQRPRMRRSAEGRSRAAQGTRERGSVQPFGMSDEQREEMRVRRGEQIAERRQLSQQLRDGEIDRETYRNELRELRQENSVGGDDVLSEEDIARRNDVREAMREDRRSSRAAARAERSARAEVLGLSDDQARAIGRSHTTAPQSSEREWGARGERGDRSASLSSEQREIVQIHRLLSRSARQLLADDASSSHSSLQ